MTSVPNGPPATAALKAMAASNSKGMDHTVWYGYNRKSVQPEQFGAYLLLERIGQGAQGDVHLARRGDDDGPLVVIKRIAADNITEDLFVRRFRHEATVATAIDSDNVVRVYDVGEVGDRLYIVMEYIEGKPFSRVMSELRRVGEHTSLTSIVDVVAGALDGLHALHTAVGPDNVPLAFVHRDVAPKNLMLSEDGIAKVIDLGLGRSAVRDWQTAQGIMMGSPGYIPPEQVMGMKVDHRGDIFGMGAVLFEFLTLRPLMQGATQISLLHASTVDNYIPPSSLRSDVPFEMDAIVRRALAMAPADRFDSAAEFAEALRHAKPRKSGNPAQTLLKQMEWQELLETRVRLESLKSVACRFDEMEAARQVVFTERVPSMGRQTDLETMVVRERQPVFVSYDGPPQEMSASVKRAAVILAGLVLLSVGWFGRGLLDPPPPPVPTPSQQDPSPTAVPQPGVTPSDAQRVEVELVAPRPIERPAPKPVRVSRPPPVPTEREPTPPPPPPPPSVRMPARARALAARAAGTPLERRARQLVFEVTASEVVGASESKTETKADLMRRLDELEAELSSDAPR